MKLIIRILRERDLPFWIRGFKPCTVAFSAGIRNCREVTKIVPSQSGKDIISSRGVETAETPMINSGQCSLVPDKTKSKKISEEISILSNDVPDVIERESSDRSYSDHPPHDPR